MPMFKTINAHKNCSAYIQNYLEHGKGNPDRALARDFLNLSYSKNIQDRWATEMDLTREMLGLVGKYNSKDRISFFHMIISPDPKDAVDLDTLRQLASEFAREYFGDDEKAGKLGTAEVAIIYHDDNKNNIPHAHLIVNNCDLQTGKALQIDNKTNKYGMPDKLQELGKKYNLSYFENEDKDQTEEKEVKKVATQGVYLTKKERALREKGQYSWKDDLRNRIDLALRTSSTPEELEQQLDKFNVGIRETTIKNKDGVDEKDWVYTLKNNPARWRCTGYRLGQNYVQTKVLSRQDMDLSSQRRSKRAGWTSGINNYVQEETQKTMTEGLKLPSGFFENNSQEIIEEAFLIFISLFDRPPDSQPISSATKKIKSISMFRIENRSELDSEIKTQENLANKFPSDKTFEQNAKQLKEARSFIQENNLFAGAPRRTGRQLYRIQQLKEERANRTSSEDRSSGGSSRSTDSPSHYVERSRGRSR